MPLESLVDKYRVFFAYRDLLVGKKLRFRKQKLIRSEVAKWQGPLVQAVFQDLGLTRIVLIICELLKQGAFESTSKAESLFGELLTPLTTQNVPPAEPVGDTGKALPMARSSKADSQPDVAAKSIINAQDSPNHLPFRTQHFVLTSTQHLLEECCFQFATKWFPNVLVEREWDCIETIELNKITSVLYRVWTTLPAGAVLPFAKDQLRQTLHQVDNIRHLAVHRIRASTVVIRSLLKHGYQLAQALRDLKTSCILDHLYHEIIRLSIERDKRKMILHAKYNIEWDEIARQRQNLEKREKDTIALMVNEEKEDELLSFSSIETNLKAIFLTSETSFTTAGPQVEQVDSVDLSSRGSQIFSLTDETPTDLAFELEDVHRWDQDGLDEEEWKIVLAAELSVGTTLEPNMIFAETTRENALMNDQSSKNDIGDLNQSFDGPIPPGPVARQHTESEKLGNSKLRSSPDAQEHDMIENGHEQHPPTKRARLS